MPKKHIAMAVALAVMAAGSAWGYGVEGWPKGTPDHVLSAGKNAAPIVVAEKGCGDCCGGGKSDKNKKADIVGDERTPA